MTSSVSQVARYPPRRPVVRPRSPGSASAHPLLRQSNMLAIAKCPCPGDFISVGIRSTFSKRSISGTALTTDTSRSGGLTEVCTSFGSMNLSEWELTMFKSA